jgi:hypothetical protein
VITDLDGEPKRVSLSGKDIVSKQPATAKQPEFEVVIPAITQAEIENLIKTGHPLGSRFVKRQVAAKAPVEVKN